MLATLDTEYRIESQVDNDDDIIGDTKRLLTVWNRKLGRTSTPLLGPTDLGCELGREETSQFFTKLCGRKVKCVVASTPDVQNEVLGDPSSRRLDNQHTHQFGNTSAGGLGPKGDTRTIHIVNENTVKQFAEAVFGVEDCDDCKVLTSTRFRPNIVIDNLDPWAEFDLIGKTIELVPKEDNDNNANETPLRLRIVSRTVRCEGVGVDPLHPDLGTLDIPHLLSKHFPKHGPYLGVYAVVDDGEQSSRTTSRGRVISVGDTFRVL